MPNVRVVHQSDATANSSITHGRERDRGGAFTVTLPPFSQWVGKSLIITKIDTSANLVTWLLSGSDTIPGVGNTGQLTQQGQTAEITATSA